jgi:pimeloyl-ACP methyl ester carboxylesterase
MRTTPETVVFTSRKWRLLLVIGLITGALNWGNLIAAANSAPPTCDKVPTGVSTSDYFLDFKVPDGLMPDPQFNAQPAKLQVHRVQPVYANGRCPGGPTRAAVLIHGRTRPGPVAFDLRQAAPDGGTLSVQEGLAHAGIDTFAPSLLGYGQSTTFARGLDDPANASLRSYSADGTCPDSVGCDRTHNPVFPLDQQGTLLIPNPLSMRSAHTSNVRFARTDVWVRDIRQVIDDAIARAQPTGGKVTLVGYSFGANNVGRTLYLATKEGKLPGDDRPLIANINRVVFLSPFFGGPTEETPPPQGFVTFPMTLNSAGQTAFNMPPGRESVCTGHVVAGSQQQVAAQNLAQDPLGASWGQPKGLQRSPTFSSYGWNPDVAGQLTTPTLVMQGVDDLGVPGGAGNAPAIYNALPASMTNKVLVQVGCASHEMLIEGCSDARCRPTSGTPYGGTPGKPWAGPYSTVKAALIEWITSGTFNGAAIGRFMVNDSGVASGSPS